MKRFCNILFLFVIITGFCNGQETFYGPGYQTMLISNPGLSGAEGDGTLRLSYMSFYPGNHYNLNSFYTSYDGYFQRLHGGVGFWIADDYLGGIVNDLRGGFSYAYFLHAGNDLFINAGLSASVFHRGFSFGGAVLPDQIDPFGGISLPSAEALSERGKSVLDIGTGFLIIYKKLTGGFALNHLPQPDLSFSGSLPERMRMKLLIHVAGEIYLNENQSLGIRPAGFIESQAGYFSGGGGASFESRSFSLSALFIGDNVKNMNIQTGFSLKSGRIALFYNYRFNIIPGSNLMPFSLLHQTGLAFGLNYVDKRKSAGIISFPKM